jgi:hypothetical protein
MASGRPPLGTNLVDHLDADSHTKERLKILLQTISGELSVDDACQKLGIGQTRFFELRTSMLQAALHGVEPKPLGRPAQKSSPESERIEQLEEELLDLRVHLAAAQIREEIALTMPHLSQRHKAAKKKLSTPSGNLASSVQITRPNNPSAESSTPGSSDT